MEAESTRGRYGGNIKVDPDNGCGGLCVKSVECPYPRCIWDGYKPPELVRLNDTSVTAEWKTTETEVDRRAG